MTRPMVYFYDANTGEEVFREMNDAEYEQMLVDKAAIEAAEAARSAE